VEFVVAAEFERVDYYTVNNVAAACLSHLERVIESESQSYSDYF